MLAQCHHVKSSIPVLHAQLCRATFFGMPANENSPDPASFASLGELAALLEVFGLPVAHELARRSAKPLQVGPGPGLALMAGTFCCRLGVPRR